MNKLFFRSFLFVFLLISNMLLAQATNDECTTSIPISSLQNFCSSNGAYTNVGATTSGFAAASCWTLGNGDDVWFSFNAIATDVTIAINGNVNGAGTLNRPQVALYSGSCTGTINELSCGSSPAGTNTVTIYRGTLVVGNTYYIRVNGSNQGTFQLCINNFVQPPASGADCSNGSILCSKDAFRLPQFSGAGADACEGVGTCLDVSGGLCGFLGTTNEANTRWFKFTVAQNGVLEFLISPLTSTDDVDFVLYQLPNGVNNCNGRTSPRCVASGGTRAGMNCNGQTGLVAGEPDLFEDPGCANPNNRYAQSLNVTAGQSFGLLIENATTGVGGNGFEIDFGNSPEFVGPRSLFTNSSVSGCGTQNITFTNQSTNAGTLQWNFGSNAVPSTATGPGPHTVSFPPGNYNPVLTANAVSGGCQDIYSTSISIPACPSACIANAGNVQGRTNFTLCADDPAEPLLTTGFTPDPSYPAGFGIVWGLWLINDPNNVIAPQNPGPFPPDSDPSNDANFLGIYSVATGSSINFPSLGNGVTYFIAPMFANQTTFAYDPSCTGLDPAQGYAIQMNPPISYSANTVNCNVTIDITGGRPSLPGSGANYSWSYTGPGGITGSGTGTPITLSASADGNYTFSITNDGSGCDLPNFYSVNLSGCVCSADAGTFISTNNVYYCNGDTIAFLHNCDYSGDFEDGTNTDAAPDGDSDQYNGIGWSVYSSQPTNTDPTTDPNLVGIIGVEPATAGGICGPNGFVNTQAFTNGWLGAGLPRDFWITSVYLFDASQNTAGNDLIGSITTNGQTCYSVNTTNAFHVILLDSIVTQTTTSCNTSNNTYTVTIRVTGGRPALVGGGNFTASTIVGVGSPASIANNGIYTITGIPAGTNWTATFADGSGCTKVVTGVTPRLSAGASVTSNFNGAQIRCYGQSNGQITVTPSLGSGNYSYNWSANAGTGNSAIANNLSANIPYSVTVTDVTNSSACPVVITTIITQPNQLTVNANVTSNFNGYSVSCFSSADATSQATGNGGTPGAGGVYSYTWNTIPAQNTQTATTLSGAQTYTVTVTDANNCTATAQVTTTRPSQLTATASITDYANGYGVSCINACDGRGTSSGSGGVTPYSSYNWSIPALGQNQNTLCGNTTYTVTVTDANNCTATAQVTATRPPAPVASASVTSNYNGSNISCANACDGTAQATWTESSGNLPPFTYAWNTTPSQSTQTATSLCAGNYTVTVTNSIGCSTTAQVNIVQPTAVRIVSYTSTSSTCFNANNGTVTITGGNGTGALQYSIDNGTRQGTGSFTSLTVGNHTISIFDANNCRKDTIINITQPNPIRLTNYTQTNVSCFGGDDASFSFTLSGGTGILNVQVNNGTASSNTAYGSLNQGSYAIHVFDANNCIFDTTVVITQPAEPLSVGMAYTDITCNGSSNGTATATSQGGTPVYSYLWSNSETTNSITNIGQGRYYVTVTDSKGCSIVDSVDILEPSQLVLNMSMEMVTCYGATDGKASVTAIGGTLPYTYSWQNASGMAVGSNTESITGLPAGFYFATVTDQKGCVGNGSIQVLQPSQVSIPQIAFTNVLCKNGSDGTATAQPSGGNSIAYTYNWSSTPNQTTQTAVNLTAGTYSVTATDINGCTGTSTVTIGEPDSIRFALDTTNVRCYGANTGIISVTNVFGGTAPYSYLWSDGQTTRNATNLSIGNYIVTITDAHNCIVTGSGQITQPDSIRITFTKKDINCYQENTGFADANVTGGIQPFTYAWSNGENQDTIVNVFAGQYVLTVTDANNCIMVDTVILNELASAPLTLRDSLVHNICYGDIEGEIHAIAQGGTPLYAYSLDGVNFQVDSLFANLPAGNYNVTVKDALGCTASVFDTILQPDQIEVYVRSDDTINLGDRKQLEAFILSSTMHDSLMTLAWTPFNTLSCNDCFKPIASPFVTTTYICEVTDTNGCTARGQATIVVNISRPVFIPNAFTPNNDGPNDRWTVFGSPIVKRVLSLQVFDRWGEKVFEATDFPPSRPEFGWDGYFKGKLMNPQVFVYQCEVEFIDGKKQFLKGDLTLIR